MKSGKILAVGVLLGLLVFELLVLAELAFFPYLPDPGVSALNLELYNLLAPLSTVFLLGLLYAWLARLLQLNARSDSLDRLVRFLFKPFKNILFSPNILADSTSQLKILSRPRLILGISLLVSVLLALVPYRPDLNPTGALVGVDSSLYVNWINQMLARPLSQALRYSFVEGLDGSRPLLLILLYAVALTGVSPSQIIEFLPAILAPLLVLSTYIFVRYGQGSASLAGLVALFSPISFYTTVGLWGGYYATWLALVLAYLFMTTLLIFAKTQSMRNYARMYILSLALFLTHPWTWVLVLTVGLVLAVTVWRETRDLRHLESITGIIATGVSLDLAKSWIFATRTVAADIATKTPNGFGSAFWNNMVDALLYSHGGLLGSWLVLGLGFLAVLTLRFNDRFDRLLILWIGVASVAFLVLDSYHQARIVYDLPLPVLTAITVLIFSLRTRTRTMRWPGLAALLLIVTVANYALQGILPL